MEANTTSQQNNGSNNKIPTNQWEQTQKNLTNQWEQQ